MLALQARPSDASSVISMRLLAIQPFQKGSASIRSRPGESCFSAAEAELDAQYPCGNWCETGVVAVAVPHC